MIDQAKFLAGKRILVTGAAGTIGRVLVDTLLNLDISKLYALDNNETGVFRLEGEHPGDARLRAYVGDVRDYDKLYHLMSDVDVVFHGAALKHVTLSELSPFDAVQTNIIGVQNLINAALASRVSSVVFMSSDKAVNPTNVMGTSKLMGERLITAANTLRSDHPAVFTSVRFGNVLGSRGSVLEVFAEQVRNGGPVTLTDPAMTRFVMSPAQAVRLVVESAALAHGGEVFVTKMPVLRITDLARATIDLVAATAGIDPASVAIVETGIRPGEKLYEELLNEEEVRRTLELDRYYVVRPAFPRLYNIQYDFPDMVAANVSAAYRSDRETCLSIAEISDFLVRHALFPASRRANRRETA